MEWDVFMAKQSLKTNIKSMKEGKLLGLEAGGKKIVLCMLGSKVYGLNSVCTHKGGPLEKGRVDNGNLICPWHGGTYDIKTGKASPKTSWVHDTDSYKIDAGSDGELSAEI